MADVPPVSRAGGRDRSGSSLPAIDYLREGETMPLLQTTSNADILTIQFVPNEILDALMITEIQDELLAILDKARERNILLDFRAVRFLSSAALGMLMRAYKKCDESRLILKLCNLTPSIREIFKITCLEKTFEIHTTAEEAEKAFTLSTRLCRSR
jgi:anti-sigma B factor antagonist